MTTYAWPPGRPAKGERVSLDCGSRGPQFSGTVVDDGPTCCVVRWDHGPTQAHPTTHLVPEEKS